MSYGVLPFFSSQLYNFGNMNEEASSSSTFPQELVEIRDEDKVRLYSNEFRLEPELYNYYQQVDHRATDVPIQCPVLIDYQSVGVNNNYNPILQQTFSPRMKLSDWRCQQSFGAMENPKKRMNDVNDQKVVNKKLAQQQRSQGNECVRKRVPMRRSQKLADKITALQKLVSPYGKTDTASVLQEAHISINILHDQIQVLFSDVGELKRYSLHYDRSGRSKGTAEVEYLRHPDAMAAIKRYNNVQLDGKPMKLELVGVNIVTPVPTAPVQKGVLGNNPSYASRSGVQSRIVGRGQERGATVHCGSRTTRDGNVHRGSGKSSGADRERPKKVSAEDLDADLEKYRLQAMNIN